MPEQTWFIFDLGNTVIRIAYERVLDRICKEASVTRDDLLEIWENAGGYHDMERGAITFWEFYEFLAERANYRGDIRSFHEIWSDFFDGPVPGIEEVLERVRKHYRVAFLSNSNEVHAEVIQKDFASLFQKEDRFIFSHRFKVAKPDPEIFDRALEVIGALPQHAVYVDDLVENVLAARGVGIRAFQFRDSLSLLKDLEAEGLLPAKS